jgi:hypothetical protein
VLAAKIKHSEQEISLFLANQDSLPPFEISQVVSVRSPAKIVLQVDSRESYQEETNDAFLEEGNCTEEFDEHVHSKNKLVRVSINPLAGRK